MSKFIHYSLNLYKYTNNAFKNWEGVQLFRLILRLFNALFILNFKFHKFTAIVQLKVTISKSLNLKKNLSFIFHYSLNLYRYKANLLKIWKVYNYAD